MSTQNFGGVIWTNHAIRRMQERGLQQSMAYEAFAHPDRTSTGTETGTTQYHKQYDKSVVTTIAKRNEKNEWLILSAWIDPPLPGTADSMRKEAYKGYQKATFWGKIWITVKRQLGLSKY